MVKHHYIVVQKPEGIIKYLMKQWLRDNPQYLPKGMDTSNTSQTRARHISGRRLPQTSHFSSTRGSQSPIEEVFVSVHIRISRVAQAKLSEKPV